MKVFEALGGRKFILAVVVVGVGLVALLTDSCDYTQFDALLKWTLTTFVAGNVVQKFNGLLNK